MCIVCSELSFIDELIEAGLLIDTGVDGLYGRSGVFEDVIARFDDLVTRWGAPDGAEVARFPPAMNRSHFERSGYMKSFPQLAGTVHSFEGSDRDHLALLDRLAAHEEWTQDQKPTELVLTPAACYVLSPVVAKRGPLKAKGALFDLQSYCFRHEPSKDPARMQMFRMREYVRFGTAEQVAGFRASWLERGEKMIKSLGLPMHVDVANDPFFGRAGRMLAHNQRDQRLKFELLIPIESEEKPTACLSFNYHQDHFGTTWNIRTSDDEIAHTACVGFGMERVALALFRHHGLDVEKWPQAVRKVLWG
jgi:seryl-tRNA synthetase